MVHRIILGLIAILACSIFAFDNASASRGMQITDSIFYNKSSMTESEIDSLINRYPKSCLKSTNYPQGLSGVSFKEPLTYWNYSQSDVSAAKIIWKSSQLYSINPQVLIVTLEKEQSLVTGGQGCAVWRYNSAMGYNCPDGSENSLRNYPNIQISQTCVANEGNAGFSRQVNRAAWQLSFDGKRANGELSWMGDGNTQYYGRMTQGWRSVKNGAAPSYYDGLTTIGGQTFKIENGSTAALYNYTPHFTNFMSIFRQWFGDPLSNSIQQKNDIFIQDGIYEIHTSDKSKQNALSFADPTVNGSGAIIKTSSESEKLRFKISRQKNSEYKIVNVSSNKSLDVSNASTETGARVQLWDQASDTCAQNWNIKFRNDTYSILSSCSGNALTTTQSGSVTTEIFDEASSNRWRFIYAGDPSIQNDIYTIETSGGMVLDVDNGGTANGSRLKIWEDLNNTAQTFKFEEQEDGFYKIINTKSNKPLDIENGSTENNSRIHIWDNSSVCSQKWIVQAAQSSYFRISNACSNKALDVTNAAVSKPGSWMQIYDRNSSDAQLFKIRKPSDGNLQAGTYTILTALNESKALDVTDVSTSNGAPIQLYQRSGNKAQDFVITRNDNGTYKIKSSYTDKFMEVSNASKKNGSRIQIWSRADDTCAQNWNISKTGSLYNIRSTCSGKSIDVTNWSTANHNKQQIYDFFNNDAQKWRFVKK